MTADDDGAGDADKEADLQWLHHDVFLKTLSRDSASLEQLLQSKKELSFDFYVRGTHIVTLAIDKGDLRTLQLMLTAGAPPLDQRLLVSSNGRLETPLVTTVRLNRVDMFHELLSRGSVSWGPDARHVLLQCIQYRRYHLLKVLLDRGMPDSCLREYFDNTAHLDDKCNVAAFVRSCLPLLVSSDLDLTRWTVKQRTGDPGGTAICKNGIRLLLYAGCSHCQSSRTLLSNEEPQDEHNPELLPDDTIMSLKAKCRVVLRSILVQAKQYRALNNKLTSFYENQNIKETSKQLRHSKLNGFNQSVRSKVKCEQPQKLSSWNEYENNLLADLPMSVVKYIMLRDEIDKFNRLHIPFSLSDYTLEWS